MATNHSVICQCRYIIFYVPLIIIVVNWLLLTEIVEPTSHTAAAVYPKFKKRTYSFLTHPQSFCYR